MAAKRAPSSCAPSPTITANAIPPQGYLQYIRSLPLNDSPELFGLHDNANITFAQKETFTLLGAILQLQPKTFTLGGCSREEVGAPIPAVLWHKR